MTPASLSATTRMLLAVVGGFATTVVVWALIAFKLETLASGMISTFAAIGAAGIAWASLRTNQLNAEIERQRRRRQHFIAMFVQLEAFRRRCVQYVADIAAYAPHDELQQGRLHLGFPPLPAFLDDAEIMSELEQAESSALYHLGLRIRREEGIAADAAWWEGEWSGADHIYEEASAFVAECTQHMTTLGQEIGWTAPELEPWQVETLAKAAADRQARLQRRAEREAAEAEMRDETQRPAG